MPMICAVTFSPRGKLFYADPGSLTPKIGDQVLVPTDAGPEVAQCMWAPQWVSEDIGGLPTLVGMAGPDDLTRNETSRRRRAEARVAAKRLIRAHGLPMKVVGVDHVGGENSLTIYFSADGRIDFRALVRDLARTLAARIELRQLSARDSAKLMGGIGSCGRDLCCATFLTDFEPVSVRMAKDQDLPLNPMKISGACGRLMCCLRYEHPVYETFKASAPPVGARVRTPEGSGRVVGHDVPRDEVKVELDADGRRCACSRADVCGSRKAYDSTYAASSPAAAPVPVAAPAPAPAPAGRTATPPKAAPATSGPAPSRPAGSDAPRPGTTTPESTTTPGTTTSESTTTPESTSPSAATSDTTTSDIPAPGSATSDTTTSGIPAPGGDDPASPGGTAPDHSAAPRPRRVRRRGGTPPPA